jgi:hypothetical protein
MTEQEMKELQERLKKMQRSFRSTRNWVKASKATGVPPREADAFAEFVRGAESSLPRWLSMKGMGGNIPQVIKTYKTVWDLCEKLLADRELKDRERCRKKELRLAKDLRNQQKGQAREKELQQKMKGYGEREAGARYVQMGEWAHAAGSEPGLCTDSLQPCVGIAIFNEKTRAMALAHLAEDQAPADIMRAMMDKVGKGGQCVAAIVTGQPWDIGGSKTLNPLYAATIDEVTTYVEKEVFSRAADLTDEALGTATLQVLSTGEISRFRGL